MMNRLFVKKNTKKIIICNKVVFRKSFIKQGIGLTFHKKINDEAHIFVFGEKKKIALTMWFVFFPIDVLYLDEKKRIVELKCDFKPFSNYFPQKESLYIIELPQGTIKSKNLKLKDELIF